MTATALLDYLSGFDSLVSRSPDQIVAVLGPYIGMFSSIGKYLIMMLFIFHIAQKTIKNQVEGLKKDLFTDTALLVILMLLFGTEQGYRFVTITFLKLYNAFGSNIFSAEMFQFKGSMRTLIDAIAESGKEGIDLFNVKAMTANVIAFVLNAGIYLLMLTYYVFVSVGMFYLMIALAAGPLMAGFYFFIKRPFFNWLYLVLASIVFPIFSAVALCVINATSLVPGIEKSFAGGSVLVCLIQAVVAACFMQLVMIFHAMIFGVSFLNVPVLVISIVQAFNGMVHAPIMNIGLILGNKKKG
jgi:hypothetical protein